jgi:hypothetical protein
MLKPITARTADKTATPARAVIRRTAPKGLETSPAVRSKRPRLTNRESASPDVTDRPTRLHQAHTNLPPVPQQAPPHRSRPSCAGSRPVRDGSPPPRSARPDASLSRHGQAGQTCAPEPDEHVPRIRPSSTPGTTTVPGRAIANSTLSIESITVRQVARNHSIRCHFPISTDPTPLRKQYQHRVRATATPAPRQLQRAVTEDPRRTDRAQANPIERQVAAAVQH